MQVLNTLEREDQTTFDNEELRRELDRILHPSPFDQKATPAPKRMPERRNPKKWTKEDLPK